MSAEAWIKLAELGLLVAQALVLFMMFVLRSTTASKADVRTAHDRAHDAHHRLDVFEERIKGLPTYDVTNELGEKLSELNSSMSALQSEMKGIDVRTERTDSAVTRIENHLLSVKA